MPEKNIKKSATDLLSKINRTPIIAFIVYLPSVYLIVHAQISLFFASLMYLA